MSTVKVFPRITSCVSHVMGSRPYQEDRYVILDYPESQYMLAAVFDGMGGHSHGEYAAEIAKHAVADSFARLSFGSYTTEPQTIALQCLLHAQEQVHRFGCMCQQHDNRPGSTGVVAVVSRSGIVGISWIGDSLAAFWDGQELKIITSPHTASADSEWARRSGQMQGGDGLTRHLGEPQFMLEPNFVKGGFDPNHRLMLMSDGAFSALADAGFEKLSIMSGVEIVSSANPASLSDNATIVEVRYQQAISENVNAKDDVLPKSGEVE